MVRKRRYTVSRARTINYRSRRGKTRVKRSGSRSYVSGLFPRMAARGLGSWWASPRKR